MTSRSKADEKVQVAVRCRPMNQSERNSRVKKAVECNVKSREINVVTGTTAMGLSSSQQTKVYNFDKVFAPNATQFDVYKNVVESQLQDVLAGYNCTVLAYGQTGTGKTYTMEGERTVDEEFAWDTDPRAGIIPRALSQLFDCLEKAGCEFSVRVSLLEIYNEEIYDLLSHSSDLIKMRIYEDNHRKGSVVVSGLTEVHVRHKNEVYDIIQQGAMKRRTAATNLNEFSSRSHSVFSVTVHTKDISQNQMEEEELVKIGKLNLVDLAGSENIGRSGAVDKRAREAGNINQSLLTLGRCITALVDRAPHIPYRESKLTRLLQDSLGGSTKTSIIATISPGSDNLEETLSTLDYAARAKNIHNKPKVNQKLTKRALIKEYDDEIERLRREVIALREKNGVYVDPKRYEEMVSQIESLTAIVKQREEDVEKFQELFSQASAELSERTEKLHILHDDLMQTSKELAEQCHLKVAYMEHGTKVQDHAAELLNTANVVTEDIKKVHDKVDRVTRIQKTNMDTFGSFSGRIKENLGQLCSGTVSVLDKNKASLQETVSNLNNFGDEQNKMLDMLLTQINEWHAFMQSASQETLRSQKSLNDEMSTLVEDNRAKLEDQKVRIESKMNKHEERMKKLDDFAGSMTTLISDIKDNVASQRAQMIEQVALTLDHHQKIKGYVDRVKNTTARVLSVQEAQSQAALNNQKILMEQMQNDMRSRMEAMCKDINEGLQESIEDVEAIGQVASDFNDDVTRSVDRFDTELTEKEEKIVASVEETVGGITRCYSDGMEDMVEMQAVVDANHDVASSFCQSVKKGVSSGVGKCNDQLRVADESSSNFHKDACSVVGDTNQHRLTFIDDLLQQITSVKEKLFETGSSLQDNVESITHEVNDCYAEKLQRVVSTGETPAKKIYKYCQQIPNLPVEEEVLTNFREKIHESQEEDNEMQTEEEEVESKSDSETSSIEVNQSITIPDSGGIPFFKKKKQKSRLAKIHSTGTTKQPLSRVPFRAMQNTD